MTAPSPSFAASIASLSEAFAVRVVSLLLSATVADVQALLDPTTEADPPPAAPARGPRGRAPARPSTDPRIAGEVAALQKHLALSPASGQRGEDARKALGWSKVKWNDRLSRALAEGRIRKEGEKRATRYWAVRKS